MAERIRAQRNAPDYTLAEYKAVAGGYIALAGVSDTSESKVYRAVEQFWRRRQTVNAFARAVIDECTLHPFK